MSSLPDYYKILGIKPTASSKDIRDGYRRESLKTHPDRVQEPSKRRQATEDFQKVADAYYVLQDPNRRAAYDEQRAARPNVFTSTTGASSSDYFSQFFTGAYPEDPADDEPEPVRPDPDATFGDAFEELLRPEVDRFFPLWTWMGAASGAALGFIAGNLPGAAIGAYGGSRLGAVRDAKGKAVYEVFSTLNAGQRAQILKGLASKVLGSMAS